MLSQKNKKFLNSILTIFLFSFNFINFLTNNILGAFVSGLDAGRIYQTWPKMGETYFPNDLNISSFINLLTFENHSLVQFYHRNLAYILIIYILFISIYIHKKKFFNLYGPLKILLLFLFLQVVLGIITLISNLNIYLASAHQITSVLLTFSALNLYYYRAK